MLLPIGFIFRRRGAGLVLSALAALIVSLPVARFVTFPLPHVHDESSYLLAADTFAHGRLANPTPREWEHFETMHVLMKPAYVSKYPPAQGLLLAAGQLAGHPILGVWAGFALMAAAICWMLQAWLPPRWALLGSLVAVVRLGFGIDTHSMARFGYWAQSYWGGALAAAAGALVVGGLERLRRRPRLGPALALAAGLAVLANSRPYEGLCLALPVLLVLFVRTRRGDGRSWLRSVWIPAGLVLFTTALWMGLYDQRTTGSPFTLPYSLYEKQYAVVPPFIWQPLRSDPVYRHEVLRRFNTEWAVSNRKDFVRDKLVFGLNHFLGWPLLPLLVFVPWMLRSARMRLPLALLAVGFAALALESWFEPHYAAPFAGLIFLVAARGLRHLRLCKGGRLLVGAVLAALLVAAAIPVNFRVRQRWRYWSYDRAEIEAALSRSGGKHLVFVRYASDHYVLNEWVYNRADLETAPVIWAREMDPPKNVALRAAYRDRRLWLLEADARPAPRILPLGYDPGDSR